VELESIGFKPAEEGQNLKKRLVFRLAQLNLVESVVCAIQIVAILGEGIYVPTEQTKNPNESFKTLNK